MTSIFDPDIANTSALDVPGPDDLRAASRRLRALARQIHDPALRRVSLRLAAEATEAAGPFDPGLADLDQIRAAAACDGFAAALRRSRLTLTD